MNPKNLLVALTLFGGVLAITSTSHAGGAGNEANLHTRFSEKQQAKQSVQSTPLNFSAEELATEAEAGTIAECAVDGINPVGASLVFNDPQPLKALFPFRKTILRIIDSSPARFTNPEMVIQSMLNQYLDEARVNRDSQTIMPLEVRPGEASLNAAELLNITMQPTALINRFDLAAADGSHCGEYRIIYHQELDEPSILNRFFMIFEAQYPNPNPQLGLSGCLPIAEFWASLDNNQQALNELERFYYQGLNQPGLRLPPVIDFKHYTNRTGQIRTNNFVNNENFIWQLREFRTSLRPQGVIFEMDTVKANPLAELYAGGSFLADQFKNDFVARYMNELLAPELSFSTSTDTDIITGIFIDNDNGYNEFQSDSTPGRDDPLELASESFKLAIEQNLNTNAFQALTSEMILNRAGAMSCGGCHEFSAGKEIAPGVLWPESNGFVQITEQGALSPALTDHFLPKRKEILADFICNPPISE